MSSTPSRTRACSLSAARRKKPARSAPPARPMTAASPNSGTIATRPAAPRDSTSNRPGTSRLARRALSWPSSTPAFAPTPTWPGASCPATTSSTIYRRPTTATAATPTHPTRATGPTSSASATGAARRSRVRGTEPTSPEPSPPIPTTTATSPASTGRPAFCPFASWAPAAAGRPTLPTACAGRPACPCPARRPTATRPTCST